MDKVYSRINWENEPSVNTPLGAINLNKMDYAINEVDNRIISIDTSKAEESDLLKSLKDVTYDTSSGVFVFTWNNGQTKTFDLNIEKIPVSFSMSADGVITMTTADGSKYTADVASLIKEYSFEDSSVIDFTTTTDSDGNKHITADIVAGSITGDKLQPNYLADVTVQATNAKNSADNAKISEDNAKHWAEEAEKHGDPSWSNLSGKPFESIGTNLTVDEDGSLNAKGGTEIAAYTLEEYEAIKDTIPTGTQFIITDDFVDTQDYEELAHEVAEVKQDLTQIEESIIYRTIELGNFTMASNEIKAVQLQTVNGYIPISCAIKSGNWTGAFTLSQPQTNMNNASLTRIQNYTSANTFSNVSLIVQYVKI